MGWNDHVDWELSDAIQDLVDEGILVEDTPAYGIAQKVIWEGYDRLSPNQRSVYDTHVGQNLARRHKKLEIQRIVDSNPE